MGFDTLRYRYEPSGSRFDAITGSIFNAIHQWPRLSGLFLRIFNGNLFYVYPTNWHNHSSRDHGAMRIGSPQPHPVLTEDL